LNDSTSTKILDACDGRLRYTVSLATGTVYLKEQATATDNDKKGIVLVGPTVFKIDHENVHGGELCAIADSGTPTVFVTEVY